MSRIRNCFFAVVFAEALALTCAAQAGAAFLDPYTTAETYTATTPGKYRLAEENTAFESKWTAANGSLTYSRKLGVNGQDPAYRYNSAVLLTTGNDAAGGNTANLKKFTVAGTIKNIPSVNTAQPGLVISGGVEQGGYILTVDNQFDGEFVLLSVDGQELLGDEGASGTPPGPHHVVKRLFDPIEGHDYSVSVTVDRTGPNPSFSVSIADLTLNDPGSRYESGTFSDHTRGVDFGGTQIGYRVRNPLDGQTPAFGPLSLTVVPEPSPAAIPAVFGLAILLRRSGRPSRSNDASTITPTQPPAMSVPV
ncbi:MAG TPA: hypothetical protein VF624_01875 [Tepidisphaeraceae bacterium]|jgi:hypothetical protein